MKTRRVIVRSSDKTPTLGRKLGAMLGAFLSFLYLLNLSFGLVEIPDNLPIIGNLDEVVVSGFLYGCLGYLGINLVPFQRKQEKPVEVVDINED